MMNASSEDRDFRLYRDEGDVDALSRVFDSLAPRLLLLAGHLVADASTAEDLVQTTFLQAMRDARRYDGKRPVVAWLSGILNHRALDSRRRASLRRTEPLSESAVEALDPAELAADQDWLDSITQAIDGLSMPYREVLVLRVVHGLEPTAIAHTLGRPPGTVRMQLKRGLQQLREVMPGRASLLGAFFLEPVRGLEAVKQIVMAEASGPLAAAGAHASITTAGATLLGGGLLVKALIMGLTGLVLGLGLFVTLRSDGDLEFDGELEPAAEESVAAAIPKEGTVMTAQTDRVDEGVGANGALEAPAPLQPSIEQQLRVNVRYESTQDVAPNVNLYLQSIPAVEFGREQRTDDRGQVSFMELEAGRYELHVDRLEHPLRVVLPREQPLDLLIPRGLDVQGRVLDLEHKPVAGATIYRLNGAHHDVLQEVTTSDETGRFRVAQVTPGTEFLARASGFQPSEPGTLRGEAGSETELELMMGAKGHRLRGRVLDEGGRAVPHAWVLVGVDEDAREELRGSKRMPSSEERRKPMDLEGVLLRANEEGRFESDEVPAGYVLVVARPAASRAEEIGHATLWVRFGQEEEVVVRLRRGASVEGVVRDAQGRPVPGVQVEAEWEGTPFLGQMEDDLGPFISDRRHMTDEAGTFKLSGLLPGDYDLRVEGLREELAQSEREIGEGEVVRWNPVVEAHAHQTVRLLDAGGEPLVGWMVSANERAGERPDWSFLRQVTDAAGQIRLLDLQEERSYEIGVYAPDSEQRFNLMAATIRSDWQPSEQELVIQLTRDELSLGGVKGRLFDAAGEPKARFGLQLRRQGRADHLGVDTDLQGRFEFRAVPAGEYLLRPWRSEQVLATLEVGPGEELDLGRVSAD